MKSHHYSLGGIRPERAEQILTYLANIPDIPPVGTVIVKQDQELAVHVRGERIPKGKHLTVRASQTDQHTAWVEQVKRRYPQIFAKCSTADMFELRHLLRAAWDDPDLRRREWFCFLLRKLHAESERLAESLGEDGAKLISDAQVKKDRLEYFLKPGGRRPVAEMLYNLSDSDLVAAYRDANPPALNEFESAVFHLQRNLNHALHCRNPTCASPYFFLTKKGQKYCGIPACTLWGQRESGKRWWRENRAKPK
jgi:hypothetical protein